MSRDKHARMRKGRFEQVQPIDPDEIEGPPAVLGLVGGFAHLLVLLKRFENKDSGSPRQDAP